MIMKTSIVCFLLIFVAIFRVDAQNSPGLKTVVPASPNAAAMGKYGEIPVSMYTGIPDINIPLYSLKGRELEVPITLNYHAGGIRVEEIASWVGSGWSLNAGGVITRSIRGMPDDVGNGYFANWANRVALAKKYMTLSSPYQSTTLGLGYCAAADMSTLDGIQQQLIDCEPDIYYFNCGKYSGKFFMNENGQFVASPLEALKVQYSTRADGQVIRWTLTTPDGVSYVFGTSPDGSKTAIESNSNGAQWVPAASAWYLMEIDGPYGDAITFNYTNVQYSYYSRSSEVLNQIVDRTGTNSPGALPSPDRKLSYNQMTVPRLTTITSISGTVSFNAGADRTDLPGEKSLGGIQIFSNTDLVHPLKSWQFNYDYSTNRLTLNNIHELAGDGSPLGQAYGFTYNGSLPSNDPHGTAINSQDLWGYYNGVPNSVFPQGYNTSTPSFGNISIQGADRHSDPTYMQYGVLTKILWPTGGYTKFDYEANQVYGDPSSGTIPVPGTPEQAGQTGYTSSFSQDFTITNPDPATGKVAVTLYALTTPGGVCPLDPNGFSQCYQGTLEGINGTNYTLNSFKEGVWSLSLYPGSYRIKGTLTQTASNYTNLVYRFYMSWLEYPPQQPTPWTNLNMGGLRIARITHSDGISTNVTRLKYNKLSDATISSGVLVNQPSNYANVFAQVSSNCQNIFGSTVYLQVRAFPVIPLMPTQGGPIGYQNVTKLYGENGENGKEEYTYTTANDYPDEIMRYRPYPPSCSYDWRRGMLLQTTTYKNVNGNFIPVKFKSNTYKNGLNSTIGYGLTVDRDIQFVDACAGSPIPTDYFAGAYRTLSEFQYLQSDSTVDYDQNTPGAYKQTVHQYTYDVTQGHYQLKSTVTTNSKNQQEETDLYYPQDLTLTGSAETGRSALVSKFILTPVLDTKTIRNSNQVLETRNDYSVFANGFPLPQSVNMQVGSNPMETRMEFLNYDNYGNLTQQHKASDAYHSYIWDYHSQYPIAEIVNADPGSVAYTSFEADGTGNWTLANNYTDPTGFTGNLSYNLQNGNISKSGLNTAVGYIVSYWTNTGHSFSVTGGTGITQGKTINGWTYYEHAVSGVSTVTISGAGDLDELRLYPVNAQMTTYTYLPLVGMTSQSDVANRVTYYEYDGLSRLAVVRDQDKNVIKRYCYGYSGETGSCPSVVPTPQVMVNGLDAANQQVTITFTNTATNQAIVYNINPGNNGPLGPMPVGNYNVTMTPANSSASYYMTYTINSTSLVNYTTVNFSNITISTQVNISVNPVPLVPVNVLDGSNQQILLAFTNTLTNQVTNFMIYPGNNGNDGYIPFGTYNVTATPQSPSSSYFINFTLGSAVQISNGAVTFSNVTLPTNGISFSANPVSSVPVNVIDGTNQDILIQFTNANGTYNFTMHSGNNGAIGYIPTGTFTVYMIPASPSNTYPIVYTLNSITQLDYVGVGYNNVTINSAPSLNASPSPLVPVQVLDGTNEPVALTFTSLAGGVWTFNLLPGNNGIDGYIPQWTYNVSLTPANPSPSYPIFYNVNSQYQNSTGAVSYSNLVVNSQPSVSVTPAPQITVSNNTTQSCAVQFVPNASGGQTYTFTVPAGSSNLSLGQIQGGNYNVFMSPASPNPSQAIYWQIYGFSQTYYGNVEFGSVSVTSDCFINIVKEY